MQRRYSATSQKAIVGGKRSSATSPSCRHGGGQIARMNRTPFCEAFARSNGAFPALAVLVPVRVLAVEWDRLASAQLMGGDGMTLQGHFAVRNARITAVRRKASDAPCRRRPPSPDDAQSRRQ